VSKSVSRYFDPLTDAGVSLQAGELTPLRLHECGTLVMDARWSYEGVCSPFWRAYHNLDAGAAVRVAGERWALGPDRVVVLPPGLAYDCVGRAGVRHLWVHFSTGAPMPHGEATRPWVIKLAEPMRAGWEALYREAARGEAARGFGLRHRCAGLLWQAWAEVEELAALAEGAPRLRGFLQWLDRRLHEPPELAEMAKAAGLEKRSFLRWFRKETGRTPADYLTERRVHEACLRLRFTAESIEEVAAATGFANRHHFSRVFRRRTGRTPASFRAG
jgi:AraC-like DNA-binding protein